MNKEKSLFELKEFWISIIIPFLIMLFISIVIAINSKLAVNLSYTGFNKFVEVFKFPLGILAITFPLVALVASNHRSRQAAVQIEQGKSQNTFSNFYKHKESFHNMIERLEKKYNITFFEPDLLYMKIFPENSPVSFSYKGNIRKTDYIATVRDQLYSFIRNSSKIGIENIEGIDKKDQIKHFYESINLISERLKFKVNTGLYICWSRIEMTAPECFRTTSVTLKERKGIYVSDSYVFGHVSLCDKVMRDLTGFYKSEKYQPAYTGSPLWLWDDEHEEVLKACVKF